MSRSLKARLSAMMFLQYFIAGAVLPIFSHYLINFLEFRPFQVGKIMAMPAFAAMIAPFLVASIADRVISAERFLALSHLLAGGVMLFLSRQSGFWPVLVAYFVYGLLFVPTFALTNAVAFHHVTDAQRDFGGIRMWGPISWVVVGWGFGFVWLRGGGSAIADSRLPHALLLSAVSSWALAIYALTLPPSKVHKDRSERLPLRKTIGIFLRPNMLLLCALTFLNASVHQFYYYGMSPFLSQIGFPDKYIMPAMSMGQFGEIFVLATLGICLAKLGVKRALILGVLAQAVRCVVFAAGYRPVILAIVPIHGVCYAFFFTVAYIYVDHHSSKENRAGAQQFFNILIAGFGNLAGNLFAGKTAEIFTRPDTAAIDFRMFWLVSAGLAFLIAATLALFFKEEPPRNQPGCAPTL